MDWRTYAVAGLALSLGACGGSDDNQGGVDQPPATPLTAQEACDSLATAEVAASSIALPTRGAKVTSASLAAATTFLPEHCLVTGEIASMDVTADPITFQVALPSAWNRKLMHLGGAGWNGQPRDVTRDGFPQFFIAQHPSPLVRGYAVFGSDSGHVREQGRNQGVFALNEEMFRNFAHEQLKKTRDVVVALVQARYGETMEKTYFMGGSEGGREGFMVIQRYPQDYDAVYSLFPMFSWVPYMFKWHQINRAMRLDGGAGWINLAKANLLYNAEIAACDGDDGAVDGVISNPRACQFDPATLRCPGGVDTGDTCLSDAQIATTQVMYGTTTFNHDLANGVRSVPAYYHGTNFPVTLGTTATFDLPSVISGNGASTIGAISNHADTLVRYVMMRDENADTLSFDPSDPPAQYRQRVTEASAMLDATSTDISEFLARGGKWIIVTGTSDELVVTDSLNQYYEDLVDRFGAPAIADSVRYYLLPGFAHTTGPFNPLGNPLGGIPALDALENWVEDGVGPGNLITRDAGGRTRPLCVYPSWPRYEGTGDVDQASNFVCAN